MSSKDSEQNHKIDLQQLRELLPAPRLPEINYKISERLQAGLTEVIFGDQIEHVQQDIQIQKLESYWPQIAGTLSKHSQPISVKGDRLLVRIEKDVYAQDFQLLRTDIIKNANRILSGSKANHSVIKKIQIKKEALRWNRSEAKEAFEGPVTEPKNGSDLSEQERLFLDGLEDLKR